MVNDKDKRQTAASDNVRNMFCEPSLKRLHKLEALRGNECCLSLNFFANFAAFLRALCGSESSSSCWEKLLNAKFAERKPAKFAKKFKFRHDPAKKNLAATLPAAFTLAAFRAALLAGFTLPAE